MEQSEADFWSEKQKENIRFFNSSLKELLSNPLYKYKFVVICDKKVVGIFDTSEAAIEDAAAKWPVGEFIIQQIISDDDVVGFLYPAIA